MSDLVGNPEDRFSRVAAHLVLIWNTVKCVKLYVVLFRLGKSL